MRIGIVDMRREAGKVHMLVNAIKSFGCTVTVINGVTEPNLCQTIRQSPIHYWIFSGSQYHVTHEGCPQIPMDLLKTDKKFLMICYSMESVLVQLGMPIQERYIHRRGPFQMTVPKENQDHPLFRGIQNPMKCWRAHRWYFPNASIHSPIKLLASYNGEAMIATYKNMVLVQHHPEHTADGRLFLQNWLEL
jgi:hypothetical protein